MVTDPLFYRLFETSPETFFILLGMPNGRAREMASRYLYQAIEFKETAHRADGVFQPREPDLPVYFVEVQFYSLPSVYADLLVKIFTYLKQNDPAQPFCGVVLFANRSLEPTALGSYKPLLDAGLIRRHYLNELEEVADAPLGLSIVHLIQTSESQAPAKARELITRVRAEVGDESLRDNLIELIETAIIYKLSHMSREDVQAMLQIHDIRQSRIWQEAREEGLKEGLKEGIEKGKGEVIAFAIKKMASKKMPAEEIAALLELDIEQVRKILASADQR